MSLLDRITQMDLSHLSWFPRSDSTGRGHSSPPSRLWNPVTFNHSATQLKKSYDSSREVVFWRTIQAKSEPKDTLRRCLDSPDWTPDRPEGEESDLTLCTSKVSDFRRLRFPQKFLCATGIHREVSMVLCYFP